MERSLYNIAVKTSENEHTVYNGLKKELKEKYDITLLEQFL